VSGTGALKAAFPFVFMAPTRYGLGSQVQLQKPVEFRQGVTLTGAMNLQSTAFLAGLSGFTKAACVNLLGSMTVSNMMGFAGEFHTQNATLNPYAGNAALNDPAVDAALPTGGMLMRFDASDVSSFTLVQGNLIAEWRDVSGHGVVATPKEADKYPVYRENELGAFPVVDTKGWRSAASGAALKFGTPVTGVKTVFAVLGTEMGGGWLLGSIDGNQRTFHRGGDGKVITEPLLNANTSYSRNPNAVFRRNGETVDAYKEGYTGNFDLLSVTDATAFQPIAGLAFDNLGGTSRDGYLLIAEVVAYDREMTQSERKQVEKHLFRKWFGGRTDLRTVIAKHRLTLNVGAPVDGASEPHINRFYGRGGLQKEGPGTLWIDRPYESAGPWTINGGTLAVADTRDGWRTNGVEAALPPAEGCVAHFDASKTNATHMTLDAHDRVLEWFDADGRAGVSAFVTSASAHAPVLRRDALNDLPLVEIGYMGGNTFFEFRTTLTQVRAALMVINSRFGGGHLLCVTNGVNNDYIHRGSTASAIWSGYDVGCSLFTDNSRADVWCDGVPHAGNRRTLTGAPEVLGFNWTGNATVNRIGRDRQFTERTGGQQIAEILLYTNTLTEAQMLAAQAYLRQKWFPADRPALNTVRANGDGTLRAEGDLKIGTFGGTGALTLAGSGTVTVEGLANNASVRLGSSGGVWDIRHDRGEAPAVLPVTEGLLAWFDPSEASTVTTNASGQILGFVARNNPALTTTVALGTSYPTLTVGAVNGRAVVNCGAAYSNRGLIWSESFTNAHTVVCVFGSQDGGGQIFGTTKSAQAFPRDITAASRPILSGGQLVMVDAWLDGAQVDAYSDGFNGGYQILTLVAPTEFKIDAMGYRQSDNCGGNRYGEVLVYDRPLSEAQRKAVEAYLAAKWFNTPIHGYTLENRPDIPGQATASNATCLVVGEGVTTSIGWLTGNGGFRKTGAGTLNLMGSTVAFEGALDIAAGTVRYTAAKYDGALPQVAGLMRRYDASLAETFETDGSGNVVTWYDVNGENPARLSVTNANRKALVLADELNGLPVLDFGPYGWQGASLCFDGQLTGVNTVFMVLGSQNGGGFILGDKTSSGSSYWHRGSANCALTDALFGNGCVNGYANNGKTYLDGASVPPTATNTLSGGYQVLSIVPSGPCLVDGFAFDRYPTFADRQGGQRLGEVLFFDRTLSDTDRIAVESYLNYKWFNRFNGNADNMPHNLAQSGALAVAAGATFDLNGFTHTTTALAGGGTVTGGSLVLRDGGELTARPGETLTVNGTLRFGASGTVSLPEDWDGTFGVFKIMTSTELVGAANLANWRNDGRINGKPVYVKLFAVGNDVYLSIAGPGTLLLFQ